jgi:hypothetical protein
MGLQADLNEFSISEILYFLSHFKKNGRLSVATGGVNGEIFFLNGNAVHAVHGEIKGSEAVFNLCLETAGQCAFASGVAAPEESIKDGADHLIEEGERRRTEVGEILKGLPPMDTVLARTAQAPEESAVTIRRSDWTIMALVNGKRDIKAVIADSKLGVLEVTKTLAWLLAKNLVVDPLEVERIFREKLALVNLLLEEFGVKGTGVAPYIELVKGALAAADKDGHVGRAVQFGADKIVPAPGAKTGLSKEEVVLVWGQVADAIQKQGAKEFGPMLAKHKYQTVCVRSKV